MAYATLADVESFVGPTGLSDDAFDAASGLLEAASDFIDRYTGKTWAPGTVAGEVHRAYRDSTGGQVQIVLARPPVGSISSVSYRSAYLGATPVVLLAGTGYELIEATRGLVFVNVAHGDLVTVTYASAPTVPDDIKAATAMLAVHWARTAQDPTALTLAKLEAGTARLTYREVTDLPADIKALLTAHAPAFAFA